MSEIVRRQLVKFAPKGSSGFYDAVRARVNDYFQDNHISPYSNSEMYVKTAVMLAMYFVPYALIVTGLASFSLLFFYALWLVMGLGIVGIGCSIMHDSNHGAYTHNKGVNNFLGSLLNLLGGYSLNWKIQHNVLHHTYTNIEGLDEDIDAGPVLRMSPDRPLRPFHRFQHLYAWFVYCIMNLYWITIKDYRLLIKYDRNDLLKNQNTTLRKGILELSAYKVVYVAYILVLPILFAHIPWYHIVGGFVAMHVVAGFMLACIFQPAHVVGTSDFSSPNEQHRMEHNWAVHQIMNTADFAPNNKLVCWYIGGLNFQIEHHLFPHVCHIHYPKIAKIVRKVAEEYNLPYQVMPTFRSALLAHGKMLWKLGQVEHPELHY